MRAMLPRLSKYLLALGIAALGMSLSACKKPEYPLCKKDKHCVAERGETCVEGTCQNCKADTDCAGMGPNGEQWTCFEFLCMDPADVPAGAGGADGLGQPCTQTIECMNGLVCKAGACAPCSEDFDCQPGVCNMGTGRCDTPGSGGGGGQCQTDDECAMDEICDMGMCVFSGGYQDASQSPCSTDVVYFDFDSPKLSAEVQQQLTSLAECINANGGGGSIILEAHADPRGTEEYNIMLTDRRGGAVRDFLTNLGVDPGRMQVIAKGDLEATGTDEGSMAKDRRVQFIWQQPQP